MDLLPKDLVNLIFDYKNQLEHSEKLNKCLRKIKKLQFTYFKKDGAYQCYRYNNFDYYVCHMIYHGNENILEIERGDEFFCLEYWCFDNNKLIEYYKND